jgi:hypothetical protein
VFEGGAAIGFDHGYDAQRFYLGLALDPNYIERFLEGCLETVEALPYGYCFWPPPVICASFTVVDPQFSGSGKPLEVNLGQVMMFLRYAHLRKIIRYSLSYADGHEKVLHLGHDVSLLPLVGLSWPWYPDSAVFVAH